LSPTRFDQSFGRKPRPIRVEFFKIWQLSLNKRRLLTANPKVVHFLVSNEKKEKKLACHSPPRKGRPVIKWADSPAPPVVVSNWPPPVPKRPDSYSAASSGSSRNFVAFFTRNQCPRERGVIYRAVLQVRSLLGFLCAAAEGKRSDFALVFHGLLFCLSLIPPVDSDLSVFPIARHRLLPEDNHRSSDGQQFKSAT